MNRMADSGSFLRRRADLPVMVLSQDYELFFGTSGTIEKCLFEPTDKLDSSFPPQAVTSWREFDTGAGIED